MCIIALKKADQNFEAALVERMIEMGNDDGFGAAWVEGERTPNGKLVGNTGRVQLFKTMSKKDFLDWYEENQNKNLGIHVRNATLGDKNTENCHPYTVLSKDLGHKMDLVMFHNGTISDVQVDKRNSDSHNFATKFLRGLLAKRPSLLYDDGFQYFLCAIIGRNKLLFLDSFERFTIINQDLWSQHEPSGVWVSTTSEIKVIPSYVPSIPIGPRGQFGHGHDTIQLTITHWRWKQGTWEMDGDGRLHFHPKKPNEMVAGDTTDDKEGGGTGNGTILPSTELDEESLKEWEEKFSKMEESDILGFVLENSTEATDLLTYLAQKYDPDIHFTALLAVSTIRSNPNKAAHLIYKYTRPSTPAVQLGE